MNVAGLTSPNVPALPVATQPVVVRGERLSAEPTAKRELLLPTLPFTGKLPGTTMYLVHCGDLLFR